jgi:protein O-GlcNAc transferase
MMLDARGLFFKALDCLDAKDFQRAESLFLETLRLTPGSVPTLNNLAVAQYEQKRLVEAAETAQRVIAIEPHNVDAWSMRLSCQLQRNDRAEVLATCDSIIAFDPPVADVHCHLGYAFSKLNKMHESIQRFDRALALNPNLSEAWVGRGNVLRVLSRYNEAVASYDRALRLKGDLVGIAGARLNTKMQICDWRNFDTECDRLIASVRANTLSTGAFELLAIPSTAADQRQCAELWASKKFPASKTSMGGEIYKHDRIRLAYVSSDFREHATGVPHGACV